MDRNLSKAKKGLIPAKRASLRRGLLSLLILLISAIASSGAESAPGQITMSFEEYLDQGGVEWFLAGKREYTVQAMMVSRETSFHNEFEVTDYTVTDDGATVIIKGAFGEMWATKLPKVISTYSKPDGSILREEDFAVKDTFVEIVTQPEPDAYFAMYVPVSISVTVETAWGDLLHTNLPNAPHGDGDYLVCRADENKVPDLSDVWVLNGVVFPVYYEAAG